MFVCSVPQSGVSERGSCDKSQNQEHPCGSGMEKRGQDPAALSLRPAQASALGTTWTPRPLVFPQGKEEICKEEVVELRGAVTKSRRTDLQQERPRDTMVV